MIKFLFCLLYASLNIIIMLYSNQRRKIRVYTIKYYQQVIAMKIISIYIITIKALIMEKLKKFSLQKHNN